MLEVKQLNKKYGRKQILKDVTFSLNPGEVTALLGINGSGKSTIMNSIMQLTTYESGQILLDGRPMTKDDFGRLVYIPDQLAVQRSMTIREALDFMASFYSNYSEDRAKSIVKFFKLNMEDKIDHLSKGNQSKVNLLLGLVIEGDFVFMDEPFSGIDFISREEIQNIFFSDLIQGRGVLLATHDIDEIERIADRVLLLRDGQIIKSFAPEDERLETGRSIKDVMREVYIHEEV